MVSRIKNSIVIKMALLVLGSTFLIMAMVEVFNYTYTRKMILESAENNARNLAVSMSRRIEQEFRAVQKVPENLAGYLKTHPTDNEKVLLSFLHSNVAENPEIFGSAICFEPHAFSKDQYAWAPYFFRTDKAVTYKQLASSEYNYFQKEYYYIPRAINGPHWSDPYFDTGGGDILMTTYSVPLYRPGAPWQKDSFLGAVTADVSLKWLTGLVTSVHVGKNGFAIIITETGIFVSHPDKKMIMEESMFSLADKFNLKELRVLGRAMVRNEEGFMPAGIELTGEQAFLAYARIPSTGWSIGIVQLKSDLFFEMDRLHLKTIALAVVGILMLLGMSVLVASSMARPLISMAGITRQIAKGDLSVDLSHIKRTDEVGLLALSLEKMVEGLKQKDFIRDTFGRYLTKEVVAKLLESEDGLKLGGESRQITLMMSDLRGFTALTAHMPPEKVISFLNRYLGQMVEVLMKHGGVIDEIIGDGILAFFGAPEPMEDHSLRAVACALEMQSAMAKINAENAKEGIASLEMGVAVHTGNVVVGNIGSEKRSKYGAVGSDVNFTGRMESYTVGGQVLISEAAYKKTIPHVLVKETIQVQMKGIPGKINLYDIHGVSGPYSILLPKKNEIPNPLKSDIGVHVNRLNQKIVDTEGIEARMTHTCQTSAILVFSQSIEQIDQWENIRVHLPGTPQHQGGEFYGKVVRVTTNDTDWEALVKITSLSPAAQKVFSPA